MFYEKKILTVMVNNSNNINQSNTPPSPQLIEHNKYDIWRCLSVPFLMVIVLSVLLLTAADYFWLSSHLRSCRNWTGNINNTIPKRTANAWWVFIRKYLVENISISLLIRSFIVLGILVCQSYDHNRLVKILTIQL